MIRTYKFLLRPTGRQVDALTAMLGDHRVMYNAALQERRDAYRMCGVSVRYGQQCKQLTAIRAYDSDHARWSFSSQQATLRRLDKAFAAFYRRVKAGQKPGFPRFKGAGHFDSVTWPTDGDACRWMPETKRVRLQGVGHVRVHAHREVQGQVKTLTVKREGGRWYLVLACADVPMQTLTPTGAVIGIDMGIASFLTTSEGKHIPNPRHGRCGAERLAVAQQALSRCKRKSNRRRKVRARVAKIHAKVVRQRLDHAHKTALGLVRGYDLICHEDLRIANMCRSASGNVDEPGRNVAAKSGLNRSILDAGWGVFLSILSDKAESAGRIVIAVDPRNTSRTCPSCGHCCAENRVTQAEFRCVRCGLTQHADVVGALNILRVGLALHAAEAA